MPIGLIAYSHRNSPIVIAADAGLMNQPQQAAKIESRRKRKTDVPEGWQVELKPIMLSNAFPLSYYCCIQKVRYLTIKNNGRRTLADRRLSTISILLMH